MRLEAGIQVGAFAVDPRAIVRFEDQLVSEGLERGT